MPKVQSASPTCPTCRKPMKFMLRKGPIGGRKFQCENCGQTDPMKAAVTQAWLKGELAQGK